MANDENLTPFTKGDTRASEASKNQSRGPGKVTIAEDLQNLLDEETPELIIDKLEKQYGKKLSNANHKHALNVVLVMKGLSGDVPAIKTIHEKIDGKPKDNTEHSGKIEITFTEGFGKL